MKTKDYRCIECKTIKELCVPDNYSFPDTIICHECNGKAKKMFSQIYYICHQGRAGNSWNSYSSNPVSIKKTK